MSTFCRTCNRALMFVHTRAVKPMPVERTPYSGGGEANPLPFGSYINEAGEIRKHTNVPEGEKVWRIHFQDCERKRREA